VSKELLDRYLESNRLLAEVEQLIPLASQTFSKSRTQYPPTISPLFASKSLGCKTWDVDGNEYIDLVSSLAAVTLGYGDPEVNEAVVAQLELGVTLTLPGTLEYEVASLIRELVPSAEGAIRLARAYTGKDHVLISGYHGWQDWFIGTTSMNLGVPDEVKKLSHSFQATDQDSFDHLLLKYSDKIAAVILEPISAVSPSQEFLTYIRKRTSELGIVLVFDETVTGFRIAPGGAQSVLGITPDLTTFGKGIANGFPLSVLCGRAEIMNMMDRVFFSGTFGGELLSLAAAKVVLNKVKSEDVTFRLSEIGTALNKAVSNVIRETQFQGLELRGHPSWQFLIWDERKFRSLQLTKTLFLQEMFSRGVLILGSHNVTLCHDAVAIEKIQRAYSEVLSLIQAVELTNSYDKVLRVAPLEPLFRVR
jgi:glutamate-1-semialdehyde 2,1-aminomutase